MARDDATPKEATKSKKVASAETKRIQRLYDKVSDNRKNCSFEDIERLLLAFGFESRKSSGSHVFFKRGALAISVPKRKPVKETYVEQTLRLLDEISTLSRPADS